MMAREIKFRAYDITNKTMINRLSPVWFEENYWQDDDFEVCANNCGFTLMQYTGLKDKNGREIYEGDIVEWQAGTGRYKELRTCRAEVKFENQKYNVWLSDAMIIVGNIYENPELLTSNTEDK